MRLISYQQPDGAITNEILDEVTCQVWDIFIETHQIKGVPTYGQWCQFLTVMQKLKEIIKI